MSIIETIDEALNDWSVSGDAMRWTPDSSEIRHKLMGPRMPRFTFDVRPFMEAMEKMAQALAAIELTCLHLGRLLEPPRDRHHPRPLCIDGAAYHQRQRNRRKRT